MSIGRVLKILAGVWLSVGAACGNPPTGSDGFSTAGTMQPPDAEPTSGEGTSTRIEFEFDPGTMDVVLVDGRSIGRHSESIPEITEAVVQRGRVDIFLEEGGKLRPLPVTRAIDRDEDGSTDITVRIEFGYARKLLVLTYKASRPIHSFSFLGTQTVHVEITDPS